MVEDECAAGVQETQNSELGRVLAANARKARLVGHALRQRGRTEGGGRGVEEEQAAKAQKGPFEGDAWDYIASRSKLLNPERTARETEETKARVEVDMSRLMDNGVRPRGQR